MSTEVGQRVQQLVGELLQTRLGDLGDISGLRVKMRELESAMAQMESYAQSLQYLGGGYGRAPKRRGRPPKSAAPAIVPSTARKPGRPRGRAKGGVGEFAATPFILKTVEKAGRGGLRPKDIVEKIRAAVPGHHKQPSALVSTILKRLKARGQVSKKRGKWYPAA